MKNLTAQEAQEATQSVWVQFNFGEFRILEDWNGDTFDSLDLAKDFVRTHFSKISVGLATFEQALMNNAQWDNL